MSTAVEVFQFPETGDDIQVVILDGVNWFAAPPVARVLGYRDAADMLRSVPSDEKGTHAMRTQGGDQRISILSEPGLYRVLASRRVGAVRDDEARKRVEAFQRWVFHTVIPGAVRADVTPVVPTFKLPASFAEALRELASAVEELDAAKFELEQAKPAAENWTVLASGDGDYAVADAAKILSNDPFIKLGRGRLFALLEEWGWIYRSEVDLRYRAMQTAVEAGRMSEIPQSHYHPKTGDLVLDPPQVRVTVKGIEAVRRRFVGAKAVAQ